MAESTNDNQFKFASDAVKNALRHTLSQYFHNLSENYPNIKQEELYNLWNQHFDFKLEYKESKIVMLDKATAGQAAKSVNPKVQAIAAKLAASTEGNTCIAVLTRGDRKDLPCGLKVSSKSISGNYCSRHSNTNEKAAPSKTDKKAGKAATESKIAVTGGCIALLSRGDRKGSSCSAKISTKSMTGKYCARHIKQEEEELASGAIPDEDNQEDDDGEDEEDGEEDDEEEDEDDLPSKKADNKKPSVKKPLPEEKKAPVDVSKTKIVPKKVDGMYIHTLGDIEFVFDTETRKIKGTKHGSTCEPLNSKDVQILNDAGLDKLVLLSAVKINN